ncbi:MAG: D-cysteine desulfhydrase family protein [Gemmatimonadetes bacterium]|nr:D-cysteine desulfhydrase family protein [Gemmatimonadota bacterium]MYD24395.1 D-cysteine desulfhydrase family protein [Gemmatimonadota bacterium]MYI98722.1 D-cysteine desulfhydrase family protein [Gemmatimonadota bacterium]
MTSPLTKAIDKFPRVRLGHVPTPLDPASRLSAALGIELWIKRDDCTGLALGGNKVRQLEFPLGEAQKRDADTLLITSAVQSNYVRVAAAAGRRLGMETHIQLEERVPDVDALHRSSGNVLLDRLFGAKLHSFPVGDDEPAADASLDLLAQSLAEEGRRPYVIHLAPAHPPLGALGYVLAAEETLAQARDLDLAFDAVVCPTGSALTHAGLLVGFRALGKETPVYGICVRRDADSQVARVRKVAVELASMIERPEVFDADDVMAYDGVLAPGYGRLNDAVREAIALAARQEGLLLDPVYTGKTMAGLIDHVRSGVIAEGSRVLFIHTGGLPAIFAYGDKLGSWLSDVP